MPDYKVVFSDSHAPNVDERRYDNFIVITPAMEEWDDYGAQILFDIGIWTNQEHDGVGRKILLGFLPGKDEGEEGNPRHIFTERFADYVDYIESDKMPEFFTMLPSISEYRSLVKARGVEDARSILQALNDLVLCRQESKPPSWVGKALESDLFAISFMRSGSAFFAFHNAASVLRGIEFETLSGTSQRFEVEFKLPSFNNEHLILFDFEQKSILSSRINILIGKNGTGKSQTLLNLTQFLLKGDYFGVREPNGGRPKFNKLLVIPCPGDVRNTFPSEPKKSHIQYARLLLNGTQRAKGALGFGETLVSLARKEEGIAENSRWDIFLEAVQAVLPTAALCVRAKKGAKDPEAVGRGNYRGMPLESLRDGREIDLLKRYRNVDPKADLMRIEEEKVFPLSAGQNLFVRFAASVALHIENGTLLLFDEPETHLHPNLITQFVKILDKILLNTGSQAIIATHSAYLVRELARGQVKVLKEDQGSIYSLTPRLRTLGADVGEISQFVFGDELFGRLSELVGGFANEDAKSTEELLGKLEGELATEAWMTIRRILNKERQT